MKKLLTFNNSIIIVSIVLLAYMILAQFNDTLFETSKWILWILSGIAFITTFRNKTMFLVGFSIVLTAVIMTQDLSVIAYENPSFGIEVYRYNLIGIIIALVATIANYAKGGMFSNLGHPLVIVAVVLGAVLINNLEYFFVIQHGDSNVPIFIPQLWEYSLPFLKVLMVVMYIVCLYVINISLYIRKRLKEFVRTTI